MAGISSFIIPNDAASADGAAVFPAQARPSALDYQILGAAAARTGVLAPTVNDVDQGWPYITPALLTTVQFITGTTTTVTLESTSAYFPASGTAYITDPTGQLTATLTYTGISGSTLTGVTSSGGVTFAVGSTVSALSVVWTGAYYMVQGERYQCNALSYAKLALSPPDTTYPRWDFLYFDPTNTATPLVLEGTPSPVPVPPTLTIANGGLDADGEVRICPLATIYVPANAKIFSTANNMVSKRVRVNFGDPYFVNGSSHAGTLLSNVQRYYTWTAWGAAKTPTLPAASAVPAGYAVTIMDTAGGCSGTFPLTVSAAGSDTINGASTFVATTPYCSVTFVCDGTSKWTVEASRGSFGASSFAGDVAMGGNKITGLPVSSAAGEPVVHEQIGSTPRTLSLRTTRVQSPANTSINLLTTDTIPGSPQTILADGDCVESVAFYTLANAGRRKWITITVAGIDQCILTEVDDSSTAVEIRIKLVRISSTSYRVQTTLTMNGTVPGTLGGATGETQNVKHFYTERTGIVFTSNINFLTYFQINTGAVLGDASLQFSRLTYYPA